ncbi:X-linked interleukin-1 receptor accessory protein-like 2 isoform X2 [Periplaneta americana]|uniref:X-linked interleukin-1 receptor accessory protein-like 2 isoform X2 n=1 Tax=Periplaneta americana TaxID=6978 RepID=UPI0037E912F4
MPLHLRTCYCFCNYTDIEQVRYKDEKLISPTNENVTFHFYFENNQTLATKRITEWDNGNYTCKVYNGSDFIKRDIRLKVFPEEKYLGKALLTYISEDQYAQIGESARFFCEAYIGYGKRSDSQVMWVMNEGMKFADTADGHRWIEETKRDDGVIIGEYLMIKPVMEEDFGTYKCSISNGHDPIVFERQLIQGNDPRIRTSYKAAVVIIVVFTCVLILITTVILRWHLELRLFWKDRFGKIEEDDNKEYDVFVCYDQTDAEFALGVLVHKLESDYKYKCFAYERDSTAGDWIPEIYTTKIRSSRRFLMVLSPAVAINNWCTYALYVAIAEMLNLHSKIICVVLQDIPWKNLKPIDNKSDRTLQHILRVVRKVQWKPSVTKKSRSGVKICAAHKHELHTLQSSADACCGSSEESLSSVILDGSKENIMNSTKNNDRGIDYGSCKFWTSLRIHLPPKRPVGTKNPS